MAEHHGGRPGQSRRLPSSFVPREQRLSAPGVAYPLSAVVASKSIDDIDVGF